MSDFVGSTSQGFAKSDKNCLNSQLDENRERFGTGDGSTKADNLIILCEKVQKDVLGLNIPSALLGKLFEPKRQLYGILKSLQELLVLVKEQMSTLKREAPRYDSKLGVKANGYRSFHSINCKVVGILTGFLIKLQEKPHEGYDVSFKTELEYWVNYLAKLSKVTSYLIDLEKLAKDGHYCLFPEVLDLKANATLEKISESVALEDVSLFFGRGAAIHVHGEVRNAILFLIRVQAIASDLPYFSSHSFSKILASFVYSNFCLKYLYDDKYLGQRILSNARNQQVTFCKRFYNASELPVADFLMKFAAPTVPTNVVIPIPPKRIIIKDKSVVI